MSNHKQISSLSPALNESPGTVLFSDTEDGLRAGLFRMKDNTFYFQHDNTSHVDEKILDLRAELGYEGYGVFWALLELLHQNNGVMQMNSKRLAFALQVDEQMINRIINDFDLFIIKGDIFYSKRLLNQIEYRALIVSKRRAAGSIGGKSKAKAKQKLSKNIPKERKEKEIKDNSISAESLGWDKDLELGKGIKRTYPKLFQMKAPLRFDEHNKLIAKHGPEKVKRIYEAMQNKTDLLKKYESAYLTANNWLNR